MASPRPAEGEAFLQNGENKSARDEVEIRDEKEEKCCTLKCWLICLGVVFGLILLVVIVGVITYKTKYEGDAEEATAEEILDALKADEKKVQDGAGSKTGFNMSGIYMLSKFDEHYAEYLEAVGVPSIIVSLITSTGFNEIIKVTEPERKGGVWSWEHTKSSGKRENWFRLGEEFEFEYGDKVKGVKHKVCNRTEENVLFCDVQERSKNMNMTETYTFSDAAMVQRIELLSKFNPIVTVRLFDKTTKKELEEELERQKQEAAENNPFDDYDEDPL